MELDDISFDMGEIADSGGTECGSDLIDGFVAPGYERVMASVETVLRPVDLCAAAGLFSAVARPLRAWPDRGFCFAASRCAGRTALPASGSPWWPR